MNLLHTGEFVRQTNETLQVNGLTLTDTEYTHAYVDWHYHENAYFTFILQGGVKRATEKRSTIAGPEASCFIIGRKRITISSQKDSPAGFVSS